MTLIRKAVFKGENSKSLFQEGVNEIIPYQFFKKRDAHFWQLHLTLSPLAVLASKITEGNKWKRQSQNYGRPCLSLESCHFTKNCLIFFVSSVSLGIVQFPHEANPTVPGTLLCERSRPGWTAFISIMAIPHDHTYSNTFCPLRVMIIICSFNGVLSLLIKTLKLNMVVPASA